MATMATNPLVDRQTALEISRAFDPVMLMRDCGLEPDPWQARLLRSTSDRVLLLCARQMGKSTCVALLALHQALYHPGSLTLLLAPVERQSEELFRKLVHAYWRLGRPVAARRELALSLELANDSRVVALPGKEANVRSFSSVNLLIVDEAARVADDLVVALSPMLQISRGRFLMLSTPFGRRGVFFNTWESGDPAWERIQARASECPRYDPEYLAAERRLLGPRWFSQEYESQFIEAEGQVFSATSIEECFQATDDIPVLQGF
jgi:hypothetical protein